MANYGKARYVHRVWTANSGEGTLAPVLCEVSAEPTSPRYEVTLAALHMRELIRAAMNVGLRPDDCGGSGSRWDGVSAVMITNAITSRVSQDGYEAHEWQRGEKVTTTEKVTNTEIVASATTTTTATATAVVTDDGELGVLRELLRRLIGSSVDEARVREIVSEAAGEMMSVEKVREMIDEAVKHLAPVVTRIEIEGRKTIEIEGRMHAQFAGILKRLTAGLNVYAFGPPGTGKTTAFEQAAKALDLPFYSISCSPDMMTSRLLGYMDATGQYRGTDFRLAWEFGGVFLLDEGDNATGSILAMFNQGLANGMVSFPDRAVRKHPDCFIGLAANTTGTGPNASFPGRTVLDAATLDRFVRVAVPYDEDLERVLVLAAWNDTEKAMMWHEKVIRMRRNVATAGLRVFITPRFAVKGATLLSLGESLETVVDECGLCAETLDVRSKIVAGVL